MQSNRGSLPLAGEAESWDADDDVLKSELCSDASVFIVDPQFRITWANDGFYRQNLNHPHEVLGQPAQQYLPKRYFTEQGNESVSLGKIRGFLARGELCRAEASHYRRDGTSFWVALDFVPVTDGNGVLSQCFILQRDITVLRERRLQLHRTSMIARYTHNPVVITGPDFVVEWVNDAWVRTTGYTLEEVRGREARDVLSGRETDESRVLEAYKAMRSGRCATYENTYYRKDGSPFIVAVDGYPVAGEDGDGTNFFGVYRDITESRRTRDQLLRMAMVAQYTDNGVVITDREGRVEWVNRGLTALLGHTLADLEGQDARALVDDGTEIDWAEVAQQLEARQSLSACVPFCHRNGKTVVLDVDMTPIFDDEGALLNIILIQRRHLASAEEGPTTRH